MNKNQTKFKVSDLVYFEEPTFTGTVIEVDSSNNQIQVAFDSEPDRPRWVRAEFLHNSTSARESEQDSPSLESKKENLNSSDSVKLTTTAKTSSASDSPESQSTPTCRKNFGEVKRSKSMSLQPRPHANPSQSRENDLVQRTKETVFPQSLTQSELSNPISLSSKTCQVFLTVLSSQDSAPVPISTSFSVRWMKSATVQSGFVLAVDTLERPSLEKGYCWLESPNALSHSGKGRPPGQSRLEGSLKKKGLLKKGEVLNPVFLSNHFSLPATYLSPSEFRHTTQLLEDSEKHLAMSLTPESPQLLSDASSTWIPCVGDRVRLLINLIDTQAGSTGTVSSIIDGRVRVKMDIDPRPGKPFYVEVMPRQIELVSPAPSGSDSTSTPSSKSLGKKRRPKGFGSGGVHWRTVTRNGRDYRQAHYHWRENGKKRTKYIRSRLLETVLQAEAQKRPVVEILELLGHKKISPSNLGSQISPSNKSPSKIELLGDISISPSNEGSQISPSNKSPSKDGKLISPSSTSPSKSELLGDMEISPSNEGSQISPSNKSPSKDEGLISPSSTSPSKTELLGDISISPSNEGSQISPSSTSPSKTELLGDISISPSKDEAQISPSNKSPSKDQEAVSPSNSSPSKGELLGDMEISPSKEELLGDMDKSFGKTRRHKGDGSGSIHWRLSQGKYRQPYYHYELWKEGDRLVKSTKYIPKGKLAKIQKLEEEKAPVREILKVLGVIK